MAIRGKVKIVRDTGNGYVGTVKDTAAGVEYPFTQPLGAQLGLVVDMIVKMEVITLGDGTKMAVSLDPVEKGKILSLDIKTNSGTLKDNTGNTLTFYQDYMSELGLAVGDRVSYASVVDPTGSSGGTAGTASTGAVVATCLQKV